MVADPQTQKLRAQELGDLVAEARVIVPFTGAGISTECGIRSPGGLWSRNRPIPYGEFMASQEARNEAWRRRLAMQSCFEAARPGRGHQALASLYRQGKVPAVITQNIDNLHQLSGIAANDVVELHGNTTFATCVGCGRRYDISWVEERFAVTNEAPSCLACAEPIKTATVSFGQAMPEQAMQRAADLARSCDLLLAIGSSLVVWPAASIPLLARNSGARLVIINREATELDEMADLVVRDDIGAALSAFI